MVFAVGFEVVLGSFGLLGDGGLVDLSKMDCIMPSIAAAIPKGIKGHSCLFSPFFQLLLPSILVFNLPLLKIHIGVYRISYFRLNRYV
jgi:hypothetical protein